MAILRTNWLGVTDYLIIVASFVICIAIGWFNARKRVTANDQVDDYVLGSRTMTMVPVALSSAATLLSSLNLTGQVGEIFRYGMESMLTFVTIALGQWCVAYAVIPVFHKRSYTSIYEFLEIRFDYSMRLFASARYISVSCILLGLLLYIPSISIGAVSGISYWVVVLIGGSVCILYCTIGGFKAVVWTDVFQLIMMFGSMVLFLVLGINHVGGVEAMLFKAFNGTGAGKFTFAERRTSRYSVWSSLVFGFVIAISGTVGNQALAQRIICVKNKSVAKRSYLWGMFLIIFFASLCSIFGLVVVAAFTNCDPVKLSKVTGVYTNDHIFIYAVTEFMGQYPGVIGLSLVALINGSLSTFSSFLSALATITLKDFLQPNFPNYFNPDKEMLACKTLNVVYGLIAMATSFAIPYMGGAVKAMFAVKLSTDGVVAGVFIVGMFSTRVNAKACKFAVLLSTTLVVFLASVSLIIPENYDSLPHHTTECPFTFNSTILESSTSGNIDRESGLLESFYITFLWFGPIGFCTTILLALIFSKVIGERANPDATLLSPWQVYFSTGTSKDEVKTAEGLMPPEELPLKDIEIDDSIYNIHPQKLQLI